MTELKLTLTERQNAWNNINIAKKYIRDNKSINDIQLANYILRDLAATKEADLSDLAWAGHHEGVCAADVNFLIELLEKHLSKYD